jgi:hypothetical protein
MLALISVGIGALLGGVVRAAEARYASFKEAKGMALALRAEIGSLLRIVQARQYTEHLDRIVERLHDSTYHPTRNDVFAIRVSQNYFQVFDSLCPKIGLLSGSRGFYDPQNELLPYELSGELVLFYNTCKALLEDLLALQEMHEKAAEREGKLNRQALLAITQNIRSHFLLILAKGQLVVHALQVHADRRWLGILP